MDDGDDGVEKVSVPPPELSSSVLPLRGRTLGYFGPTNCVRFAMYNFLIFRCVPCFCSYRSSDFLTGGQKSLLLYAILLTIQASRTLTLSDPTPIATESGRLLS